MQRCLLDHLGRLKQDLGRNSQAELLGSLHVDDQLELRWLLYGRVARLRALEDLVYVGGYSTTSFIRWGTSGKFRT